MSVNRLGSFVKGIMLECLAKKEKGLTLMELLIAVAIVVILAGVGIPIYLRFMASSKHAEASQNLAGIKMSEESYKLANGVYVSCEVSPRAVPNEVAGPWLGPASADFLWTGVDDYDAIDFTVLGNVHFVYEVGVNLLDPTSFEAGALGDTDGDADTVLYTCTNLTSPVKRPGGTQVTNGTLQSNADND
jgi:prepilin-type N-terminal cleavage/methylation domain-containing protein